MSERACSAVSLPSLEMCVLLFPLSSSDVSGDTGSPVQQQTSYSSLSTAQLDPGEKSRAAVV